jgi:uncharacterized protein YrrD
MLMLSSKLKEVAVMSLQTGAKIAQTTHPIIDPGTLDIVAYHLSGRGLESNSVLLLTRDIREVGNMGFIVDSADELVLQEDMVKLRDIIKLDFHLIDMDVIDDQKTKLGRIDDYSLDPMDFKIHQLHVKRPLIKSLQTSDLIINRTQIIEVNNKNIVVSSASLDEKVKPTIIAESFVNPFRKSATPSTGPNALKE